MATLQRETCLMRNPLLAYLIGGSRLNRATGKGLYKDAPEAVHAFMKWLKPHVPRVLWPPRSQKKWRPSVNW
jgi:hypothetical protein